MTHARFLLSSGSAVCSGPGQKKRPTRRVLLALAGVVGLGAWCACTPAGSPDGGFLGSSTPLQASRLGEGRRRVDVARRGARDPGDLAAFQGVPADEWLTGTVTGAAPFGLFVSVTAPSGAEANGLVHITQIRDGFVENPQNEAEVGQEVKVRVVRVDAAGGKMSLSMKEAGAGGGGGGGRAPRAPSDLSAFQGISSSEWLTGKVARIAPFGLFVTVSTADGKATADGLVHITQIRDGYVESTESEAQVGQEVQVRVVSVDAGAGKMGLSMKGEQA